MMAAIVVLYLGGGAVLYAQRAQPVGDFIDRFGESLTMLKDSSQQLSAGNAALAIKNDTLRASFKQMQMRLAKEIDENNNLTKSVLKLQDVNPSRAKQITRLEKDVFDINNAIDRLAEEMKINKENCVRAQAQEGPLTQKLAQLGIIQPPDPPAAPDPRKERLQLLKMIYESKNRQENLYAQISAAQKQIYPTSINVDNSRHKQDLLDQIKRTREEITQLKKGDKGSAPKDMFTQDQMRALEVQIKDLQKNHDELEDLVDRMKQKMQKFVLSTDQRNEMNKLKGSLESLNIEGNKMKQDLGDLRQQMVELDKRKTYLSALPRD